MNAKADEKRISSSSHPPHRHAAHAGGPVGGPGRIRDFKVSTGIQKSTDHLNFTPFPMTSPQTTISGDGKLEFEFTSPDNAAFYRLQAE